jgi:signal transduction histidine kinase
MSFRTRILLVSMVLVWVPLLALAGLTRTEMTHRLTEEHGRRVAALVGILQEDLATSMRAVGDRLDVLRREIENDNQFRWAEVEGIDPERTYVLDYAGRAMPLLGLDLLQIQDARGRVVSSGHFRNAYDRVDRRLPSVLASHPDQPVLVRARRPEDSFFVLARIDTVRLGDKLYTLAGGLEIGERFLARLSRDQDLAVSLVYPGGAMSSRSGLEERLRELGEEGTETWPSVFPSADYQLRTVDLPYVDDMEETEEPAGRAILIASYSTLPLQRLVGDLDLWLLAVLAAAATGTLLAATWVARRVSRPLVELTDKTASLDLERLDTDFHSSRSDEIGELSRFLHALTERLRAGAQRLREAERRTALVDLARQVTHDVRNGLTPLRNILDHLGQVAKDDPDELSRVWEERRASLSGSLDYLDGLARNYARIYQEPARRACDLNAVVRQVIEARRGSGDVELDLELAAELPPVLAEPVALRRILDNLVGNALESLSEEAGRVRVVTDVLAAKEGKKVRLVVSDNGAGVAPEDLERIFDDFYSTKAEGTGLGLSIVRRLVADFEGTLGVESEVGKGTRFQVHFPAASDGPGRQGVGA